MKERYVVFISFHLLLAEVHCYAVATGNERGLIGWIKWSTIVGNIEKVASFTDEKLISRNNFKQ